MELIRGISNLRQRHRGCVLTIGNYDGVHLGHQAVLRDLQELAQQHGCPAAVMIFEPTPQEFFGGSRAPARLTNLREKLELLKGCGVDRVMCVHFDRSFAAMEPQRFISQLVREELAAQHVIVGEDFRFGRDRAGDFAFLVKTAATSHFKVTATPAFLLDGKRVSSSAVRAVLSRGDLTAAARLLGRDYSMFGRVRQGQRLGRRLGYPTANISPRRRVLPIHGVFAVQVRGIGDRVLPGVASLGTRPMVNGSEPILEVHLFDFDDDLYGRHLDVSFIARLREERVFSDLHAMVEQMHQDARRAKEVLGLG